MSVVIGVLTIDLKANTASFSQSMDKMASLSAKTANDVKRSLEKIAAAGIAMGTALATGTAALVLKSNEAIVSLARLSQAAGTTIDKLSAMDYAAQRSGVPTELLAKGLEKLAKSAFQAQNHNVLLTNVFDRLKVKVTDSNGRLKDTGLLMDEIAPKFAKMADGAGKTALAQLLFSKSGAALIPFLNEWGAHMEELTEQARKFGLILGPEVAGRALQFHETLNGLKAAASGFALQFTAASLPALTAFAAKLADIAVKADIPKLAETFGAKLASALGIAVNLLDFAVRHANALKLALEAIVGLRIANVAIPFIADLAKAGSLSGGLEKFAVSALGIGKVLPLLKDFVGWIKTSIQFTGLLAAEEGIASAASYVFGGALSFIAAHPVGLAVTAIGALIATMYKFRDSTFEARGEIYKYIDAYTLLEKVIITRRLPTGGLAAGLAEIKAAREAAEKATAAAGPKAPEPPKLTPFDTSNLAPAKKDVFGEEIKKLDLATITATRYLAVLGAEPDKIQAVTAAQKAAAIILELNNKLVDSHRAKLTAAQEAQIRQRVAVQESVLALEAYGKELVGQQHAIDLATEQAAAMAAANLEGDEAVRRTAVANAILALSYNRTTAELRDMAPQLAKVRELLSAKSNTDVVEAANREIFTIQQETAARRIVAQATRQYMSVLREAELQARLYALNQQIANATDEKAVEALKKKRQAIIDLTHAEWEEADAREAVALRSPIEQYGAEIEALGRQVEALKRANGGVLTEGESAMIAAKSQEIFNKTTDDTVKLLLRLDSARAGVTAFFLEMQKQAKTTSTIVYDALHSTFEKLSDELTNLVTGAKTSFAKMFQDIGRSIVKAEIQKLLQTVLGKIGEKFGINLPGAKPDGSSPARALWVRMASLGGAPSGPAPGDSTQGGQANVFSGIASALGRIFSGIFSKLAGVLSNLAPGLGKLAAGLFSAGGGGGESVTSSISFGGAEASGGQVSPDQAYLVGEQGPEILFGASGTIASNAASRRMLNAGGSAPTINVDARYSQDPHFTADRVRAAIIEAHNSAVGNSLMATQEHLKRTPQR